MSTTDKRYEQARQVAMQKIEFLQHGLVYVLVIGLLAVINNITFAGYQWWLWPALGWGLGVIIHFLYVYSFGPTLTERMIKREMERLEDQ